MISHEECGDCLGVAHQTKSLYCFICLKCLDGHLVHLPNFTLLGGFCGVILILVQYPAGVGNFWYGKPLSGLCLLQSYASHVDQDFM